MKLMADEGVDRSIVQRLRSDGHDVIWVAELVPSIHDNEVLRLGDEHEAILLTADKDFGELVFRLGQAHRGVVLLRLGGLAADAKAELASKAIRAHHRELPGSFTVVAPGSVRIRRVSDG